MVRQKRSEIIIRGDIARKWYVRSQGIHRIPCDTLSSDPRPYKLVNILFLIQVLAKIYGLSVRKKSWESGISKQNGDQLNLSLIRQLQSSMVLIFNPIRTHA